MFAGMRSRKPAWELKFWIFGAMLHAAFGMCDVQKTL